MKPTVVVMIVLLAASIEAAEPVPLRTQPPEAEFKTARALLDRARSEAMKLADPAVKTDLLSLVATGYADLGVADQGVEAIRVAEGTMIPVVHKHRDDTDLPDYLYDQVALAHAALGRATDVQRVQRKIQLRETRIFNAAYALVAYAMIGQRDLYNKHVGAVGLATALVDREMRGDILAPLASAHTWMGRMDLAEQVRVGAAQPSAQIMVRASVANALLVTGHVKQARDWIQPAVPLLAKLKEDDFPEMSRMEVATVLAELGDIGGAEAQLPGIAEPAEKARLMAFLAAAYGRGGDAAKAKTLLAGAEKTLRAHPNDDGEDPFQSIDNAWIWSELGYAYAAGGMLNDAVARSKKMPAGANVAYFCQGVVSYYGMVRLGQKAAKRFKAAP